VYTVFPDLIPIVSEMMSIFEAVGGESSKSVDIGSDNGSSPS